MADPSSVRTVVVGAGATGGYFGALAQRAHRDITLVARGAHGEAMRTHGLHVETPVGDFHVQPRVVASSASLASERFDRVIVAVKTPAFERALEEAIGLLAPGGTLVTVQNGVDADEIAARAIGRVTGAHVVGAVLVIPVSIREPGTVRVSGPASAEIGAVTEGAEVPAQQLAHEFGALGWPATYVSDLRAARWAKLLWNNAWNVLTALTDRTLAGVARDPALKSLARSAMEEVFSVARAEGVTLAPDAVEACLARGDFFGEIQTSMLQDVIAKRPLEYEALCGTVVHRGRAHGVRTPVNDVLYPLLAGKSAR